jgi:phosphoribosyl-AMP cyclohydrolase
MLIEEYEGSPFHPPLKGDSLFNDIDFSKAGGLIPTVCQDVETGTLLMLAWVNKEALQRTFETGYAHYWSRRRKELWKKGESSGHIQEVREVLLDCDGDTLLYLVKQHGPACHTGAFSCFYRRLEADKLKRPLG